MAELLRAILQRTENTHQRESLVCLFSSNKWSTTMLDAFDAGQHGERLA